MPRTFIPFNANYMVKVKLTELGRQVIEDQHARLKAEYPKLRVTRGLNIDADGYTQFQMWDLIATFGAYVGLARPQPYSMDMLVEIDGKAFPREG